MAGTLEIRDDVVWMPAGWLFDNVLELIARELEVRDPALASVLLKARTSEGTGYLDLRKLAREQFQTLTHAAIAAYDHAIAEGATAFALPSFFATFLKHFEQLKNQLESDQRSSN
jgi:hypothetical protein